MKRTFLNLDQTIHQFIKVFKYSNLERLIIILVNIMFVFNLLYIFQTHCVDRFLPLILDLQKTVKKNEDIVIEYHII